MDQLVQFNHLYFNVTEVWQRSEIVAITGCQTPCHYTEFKLATEPIRMKNANGNMKLLLLVTSTDIVSRTEQKIYPFASFVAEFGGALGLFLGFSFFMIWDGMISIIQTLIHWFKRSKGIEKRSTLTIPIKENDKKNPAWIKIPKRRAPFDRIDLNIKVE